MSAARRNASERFRALCDLSQEMALVQEQEAILMIVIEVAEKVLEFSNCAIMLVDDETRELVLTEEQGYNAAVRGLRIPLDGERGISRWVAEHGRMLYVPDVSRDPRYVPGVDSAQSELAVPIRIRERTIGVLDVESEELDAFDHEEAMLLQALASQLAVALELHRAQSRLERLSVTDALTGVFNRRYMDHVLSLERDRSERYDRPLGLLMFDLDDFKNVNDRFGHQAGDRVLEAFARALTAAARSVDVVVRYGGDEFLVLLPETDHAGLVVARERLKRAALEGIRSVTGLPADLDIGVSVGAAVRMPGDDVMERLHEADRALYGDKARDSDKARAS